MTALAERIEAHCRAAFRSWDGYRYMRETRQHFSEAEREYWRGLFRHVLEGI